MTKLNTIEGIGYVTTERLHAIGITSVEALLEHGRTPQTRRDIAQKIGVTMSRLSGWVNRADLARVKGIGGEYADLLDAAGVVTVPDLAKQTPDLLHQQLQRINRTKRLVRRVPSKRRLEVWIELATELPPVVEY